MHESALQTEEMHQMKHLILFYSLTGRGSRPDIEQHYIWVRVPLYPVSQPKMKTSKFYIRVFRFFLFLSSVDGKFRQNK